MTNACDGRIFTFKLIGLPVRPGTHITFPHTMRIGLGADGRDISAEIIGHVVRPDGSIDVTAYTDDPEAGPLC